MIAIICPVHTNQNSVAAQIKNYESVHGEQAVHFLHPSIEGGEDFSKLQASHNIQCGVEICEDQWPTNYQCTIGAAISATKDIIKHSGNIGHVYYHSDSDLLVNTGFVETIKGHGCGYASRSIANAASKKSRELQDPKFKAIRDELGLKDEDIRVGRIEGCFFELGVWKEMIRIITKHYSKDFLAKESHWPLEAGLFPTIARKLLNQERASTRHLVRTKYVKPDNKKDHARQVEASKVQISDIIREREQNKHNLCFGMKWFPEDLDHPARRFVAEILQK